MFENRITDENIGPIVDALLEVDDERFAVSELLLPYNRIGNDGLIKLCELLEGEKTTIAVLDLHSNDIGTVGCKKLCETLHNNNTLFMLNLHSNYIRDQGGLYISELLSMNKSLRSLDIGENEISIYIILFLSFSIFTLIFKLPLSILYYLYIIIFIIGTDSLISLCQTLWSNTTLEEFNMDNIFPASDDGEIIVHIGEMIKRNQTIEVLSIAQCGIDDLAIKTFTEYLFENHSLKELNLRKNKITYMGIGYFYKYLISNPQLNVLNLNGNTIGDEGGRKLGRIISQNTSLLKLNLQLCGINDEGLLSIAEGMYSNTNLNELLLWGNFFGNGSATAFTDLINDRFASLGVVLDFTTDVVDTKAKVAKLTY